jgi:hypothetical protein
VQRELVEVLAFEDLVADADDEVFSAKSRLPQLPVGSRQAQPGTLIERQFSRPAAALGTGGAR